MAGKIYKLKDKDAGGDIFPISVFDAIRNTEGKTLTAVIAALSNSSSKEFRQVDEDGFYFTDPSGNVVVSITADGINSAIMAEGLIKLIENCSMQLVKSVKIGSILKKPINGMLDLSKYVDASKADFSLLNVVLMGDSITAFKNWTGTFESLLPFRLVTNIAVGNAKWSCKSSGIDLTGSTGSPYNNLWNQYNRLVKMIENKEVTTPDVIIMYAGINERYGNEGTWGTVVDAFSASIDYTSMTNPDETVNTMARSIRFTCEKVISKFPKAKIFICTPSPLHDGYAKMDYISSVVRESAWRLSAKVIDLYRESGINYINDTVFLGDGIHLSVDGGKVVGKKIAAVVRNELIG